MSRPLVIAHRGASADAPEHTLAAFELAWRRGADGIETDVRLTADGAVVAVHDATMLRTAGVDGAVAGMTLGELRGLDVGSWFGAEFAGERTPTLGEVLGTVPGGGWVFVEVKTGAEAIGAVRDAVEASGVERERVRVIGFDEAVIAETKRVMAGVKACLIVAYRRDAGSGVMRPTAEEVAAAAERCGADGVDTEANEEAVTGEVIAMVRERGLEVHCWTVDEAGEAERFAGLGVDSITTNRPGAIGAHLRGRLGG